MKTRIKQRTLLMTDKQYHKEDMKAFEGNVERSKFIGKPVSRFQATISPSQGHISFISIYSPVTLHPWLSWWYLLFSIWLPLQTWWWPRYRICSVSGGNEIWIRNNAKVASQEYTKNVFWQLHSFINWQYHGSQSFESYGVPWGTYNDELVPLLL